MFTGCGHLSSPSQLLPILHMANQMMSMQRQLMSPCIIVSLLVVVLRLVFRIHVFLVRGASRSVVDVDMPISGFRKCSSSALASCGLVWVVWLLAAW